MRPMHRTPSGDDEQEYDVTAAHPNAPMPDNHQNNGQDDGIIDAETTPAAAPQPDRSSDYIVEEYESFKRKNRRRLVGAGALVLIAGGLFAAASQQNNAPVTPALAPEAQTAENRVTAEILYPDNKASAAAPLHNIDDSKNDPIRLSKKIQAAAPLSPEEKAALEARQQRAKAQRLAQQRKQEAERAEQAAKENKDPKGKENSDKTLVADAKKDPKRNTAAERSKEREEEQRRKKAQALSDKAAAERNAKENAAAAKAREAQTAADKQRAAERAKLEKQNKTAANDKAKTEAKRSSDKTAEAPASGNRRVTIQAGAFADKNHALRVQQQLKGINYSSRIEEVQTAKGTVYRVRTGTFANQNEAKNALERIKDKGMNGVVVGK
ncbi:SPOR domain-containing protein [Conchiformibius steedae DSM 2580]|uniref:SPOR domain-containing protein n=1 Tax=Conchiformibius steedae DSM 2580 TaxID=1121352 RepID=A0AAE9HWM7_9NEIS|nr:SPOR domain-containing protein [Conchiformibius steedae]QMT32998.1 SPOR domain-containing protein [Conchiformibius steedae]URD67620.1 SPOR domain-containing protein [Conchiformibius steedae DSM 2580]